MLCKDSPVLVTGGSGYLASWIVVELLKEGYNVRTTVRSLSNTERYVHLNEYEKKTPGSLEIFEADLLSPSSFIEPLKNCSAVIHTFNPVYEGKIKDPKTQLVEPALEGTRNLFEIINSSNSIKRVVFTSSVSTLYSDNIDIQNITDGKFTEENWNTYSSISYRPHAYSKTITEKEAWKYASKQSNWDLVVLNPGFILGPALTKITSSSSIDFFLDIVKGKYKLGLPSVSMGFVDVRDVAYAHVLAAKNKEAKGRHIIVGTTKNYIEIANIIRQNYESKSKHLPKKEYPKFVAWLLGPLFGVSRQYVKRNLDIPIDFDISKGRQQLGVQYRSLSTSVKDHFEQILKDEII